MLRRLGRDLWKVTKRDPLNPDRTGDIRSSSLNPKILLDYNATLFQLSYERLVEAENFIQYISSRITLVTTK